MQHSFRTSSVILTPAVFVSSRVYLGGDGPPGGVQICTREYQDVLRLAGIDARVVAYDPDRRLPTRLRRLLSRRPYRDLLPHDLAHRIVAEAKGAAFVFLNQVDLTPLSEELRRRLSPDCHLVLLSHGLESVDLIHMLRARVIGNEFAGLKKRDVRVLGACLINECRYRKYLDLVFTLTPFETEIERWLGSRRVEWLPRSIPSDPLDWNPVPGRLGFVGTLNHPPNREGLELFLEALSEEKSDRNGWPTRVRIVGGPTEAAAELARRYPWVEYLGPLTDPELRREARTWACFAHPLFCYARGCSTKLAIGLGWEIPVITTPAGQRGYEWRDGEVPLAKDPKGLARLALRLGETGELQQARDQVRRVARSAPTVTEIATRLKGHLERITPDGKLP